MSGLKESDVGMSEYLSKGKSFSGILKLRYQDFMVNEIDKMGNVLRLTDLSAPDSDIMNKSKETPMAAKGICESLSEEVQQQLQQLVEDTVLTSSVLIDAGVDKAKRTEIHQSIREHFPQLNSETICSADSDAKTIKVMKINHHDRKRRFDRSKSKNAVTRFLLYKENISTMDAINLIVKKLHLKHSKCIQYAGNKDKRAVTVQEMTTSLPVRRILPLNKICRNIKVGNFSSCQNTLQLGDLSGNHFSIVLRDIKGGDGDELKNVVSSFAQVGFINYFGMQRFGTCVVSTYEVGKCLLSGRWADAIDFILSSITDEDPETITLVKSWRETGHAGEAYKKLRRKASFEGFLLRGLSQYGTKQMLQALNKIPRTTRMLYLHSYQSFVWNHVTSRRIRHFGNKPVVGDFVLVNGMECHNKEDEPSTRDEKKLKLDTEAINSAGIGERAQGVAEIKVLTADDLDAYTIYDVVLPLPGHSISYPSNALSWYEEIFEADQLTKSSFDHKVKEYALPGTYRKILAKPNRVNWSLVRYNDYTKPLLISDYDKMCDKTETGITEDGKFEALVIDFSLPTSSYASVALRELTKSDLSITEQSLLGDAHKAENMQ